MTGARDIAASVRATRRIADADNGIAALAIRATRVVADTSAIALADLPRQAAVQSQEARVGLAVAGRRVTDLAGWADTAGTGSTVDGGAAGVGHATATAGTRLGDRFGEAGGRLRRAVFLALAPRLPARLVTAALLAPAAGARLLTRGREDAHHRESPQHPQQPTAGAECGQRS